MINISWEEILSLLALVFGTGWLGTYLTYQNKNRELDHVSMRDLNASLKEERAYYKDLYEAQLERIAELETKIDELEIALAKLERREY